jgi:hypothetical protein
MDRVWILFKTESQGGIDVGTYVMDVFADKDKAKKEADHKQTMLRKLDLASRYRITVQPREVR